MKKIKKFLCCFLIMFLVLGASFSPTAAAVGELAIVGDMLMSMELLGDIGFIIGDSLGISDAISGGASYAGVTEQDYLMSLYRAFSSTQIGQEFGLTSSVLQLAAQGIRYASSGIFTLSQGISDYFKAFFDWAWSEDGAGLSQYVGPEYVDGEVYSIDYSSLGFDVSGDLFVGINYASYWRPNLGYTTISPNATNSDTVFTVMYSVGSANPYTCYGFSLSPFTLYRGGSYVEASYYAVGDLVYYCSSFGSLPYYGYATTPNVSLLHFGSGSFNRDVVAQLVFLGDIDSDVAVLDVSGLELAEGQVAAINPVDSFTWGNFAGTVNVGDYIGGVVEGIKTGTADIPYTDEQDQPGTITVEQTGQLELTQDSTADWPDTLPLSPETSTDSLDPFVIDLREFFPFCIPFDVYDLLLLLRAERAAPDITWRFYAPGIVDYSLELDFSVLDPVATVLRTMELLAFAVGLALATKSMIQGGD